MDGSTISNCFHTQDLHDRDTDLPSDRDRDFKKNLALCFSFLSAFSALYAVRRGTLSVEEWRPSVPPFDFLALVDADEADRTSADKLAYENEHGIGM